MYSSSKGAEQSGRPAEIGLEAKLKLMKNYLEKLNKVDDTAGLIGRDREAHIAKRILNVEILDISVKLNDNASEDVDESQDYNMIEVVPLFAHETGIKVMCSNRIIFKSEIKIRISYILENESVDL